MRDQDPPDTNPVPVEMPILNPKYQAVQLGLRAVDTLMKNTLVLRLPSSHPPVSGNAHVYVKYQYEADGNTYERRWDGTVKHIELITDADPMTEDVLYIFILLNSYISTQVTSLRIKSGGSQNVTIVINGDVENSIPSDIPIFED